MVIAKYKTEDAFDFAFDETINRHYFEFNKSIKKYSKGIADESERDLVSLIFGEYKVSEKVSFGIISSLAPVVDFNPNALKNVLAKVGVEFDEHSLNRLNKVKSWIKEYNIDKKYIPLDKFNYSYYKCLNSEECQIVEKLFNFIKNNESFDDKQIQSYLYEIINDANLT